MFEREQGWVEVFPGGVGALDQFDLLLAGESLELGFARNGVVDVLEELVVDEAVDGVACGVGVGFGGAVSGYAVEEMVGHADVEVSRAAGEDVDPEAVFAGRHGRMVAGWVADGKWEKQIPFGNDNKKGNSKGKGNCKSKGKSRFPAGMTTKKATARAKATAKAKAEADSLRE